jgi:hypothetical protein
VEPGHIPVDHDRGTLPVHPQESTTYVLEASGPGGWDSRPFAVDVLPVSIECFRLLERPPGVFTAPNQLAWTTRNATSASIAPGFPHVPVSGTQPIAPASPTTYVLRVEGGGGPAIAEVPYAPPPAWYRSSARMPGGLYATPAGVQLGDAAYFVTGIGEGGGPAKSYRSIDGVTWTATPIDLALARLGSVLLAFDGALWILGGNASLSTRLQNDVWRSTDGVTWRQVTASAPWAPRGWHAGTVFDGEMWVASGLTDGGNANDVWSSPDGVRWTCIAPHAPWAPRLGASLVATEDRMFLLGGMNGFDGPQNFLDDVWVGPRWYQLGRPGWTARQSAFAAAIGGQVYFGGGQDYASNLSDLWILEPSEPYAWTRFPGPTPGLFTFDSNLLAFRGNLFVCGGFGDDTIHYFVPRAG